MLFFIVAKYIFHNIFILNHAMYYLYKMNTFFKQVNKQKLFRYILPCPSMKNESSHMTISDCAYIIKGPVVTLNHIVSIPFQIKCLSHKMMRASKSIPGEISSHRRPCGGIPSDDGGEHGPFRSAGVHPSSLGFFY